MLEQRRPRRAWLGSLYWRIAAGFVVFLAVTLSVQAALFVWIVARGEEDVPARALETFATLVASDVATELEANHTTEAIDRHLTERYGSLPRTIWVILDDGRVISGKWGIPPPGLVHAIRGRMRGDMPRPPRGMPPPPEFGDRFRARRRPAIAPILLAGRPVGTVVVQAGRPSGTLLRDVGPLLALVAAGLILGAGALAAVLIFRPAHRRLRGLAAAARRLGSGDPVARAPESGGDEITSVARAFNQMADDLAERAAQLQASDRARRQLLADVSHELMTPLTAIRGYLETLAMPDLGIDDTARRRYLAILGEETQRLERLIGDLLDLARLEAGGGALDVEPVAIDELFGRILDRHGRDAAEKGVRLDVRTAPGLVVHADRLRLEQAVQNLAANALRHTPAGGAVQLSAELDGADVSLRIRDTGEGIPPEHLPHVFDRFYKADASRRETSGSGSGLGLSIVKAIVERHGGRIVVDSTPGQGTVFEVVLPPHA
jgi:two-component system sensor histidine kinase BaeS